MVVSPFRRLDFLFQHSLRARQRSPVGGKPDRRVECMPREFFSFNNSLPVSRSVTLTELSPALAKRFPSGENATEGIASS